VSGYGKKGFKMQNDIDISKIKFNSQGLVPAIVQEAGSGKVLMLAYMNRESLEKTMETGQTWFYSRSRQELWHKGATSGNFQDVVSIKYDCDGDTLLVKVRQKGVACHTGAKTCFHNDLLAVENVADVGEVLHELFKVIETRKEELPEGSYTTYLFTKGQDKILKKVGEETAETIIASKNNDTEEITYEMADLWYHMLVLLAYHGMTPEDIAKELNKRRK
jgi:phosphoribosyl-ATP pyrophosphohydrolase/phosphoribosyl-AMP cyclohydrolase